ncbi:MAG: MBL fold metallo-hydrolase [Flavobacteriales bacterium]|nr:MBL fold metallo-hydrolase [Flavobacteriales bacterium]
MITLTFHGAAGTVTGSKHLVELKRADGSVFRLLLDCGMFQGEALRDGSGKDRNRRFGFNPKSIDALVLSHAHIDHSGLIPRLVKEGFEGTVWCTPATRDLCAIMLEDSARIQEFDFAFDLKRAARQGREPQEKEPLYTVDDVKAAMPLFQTIDYGERFQLTEGIELTFTDAGHILGSAAVHLALDDGERAVRLSFTGDVGRYVDRLLPEPMPFPQADYLICESTYGDRDHAPIAEAEEELLRHVHAVCVEQGGRLIIPAFSIGKTQEILYTLNSLSNAGRLPRVPVFVDSPLAISATEISRRYAELFREAVRAELRRDPDLFSFHGVEFVRSPERSKQLNGMKRPCIVIAASGMMEAGRVRHHLLHALPDAANGVLAVGFCAHGTLGAELLDGAQQVRIFGERVPVRAGIRRMEFYSAHGDRNEVMRYLGCQDPAQVKRVFLVHGEDGPRAALKELVVKAGFPDAHLPKRGETCVL